MVRHCYNVSAVQERRLGFNLEPTFRCNLGCEMCPRFSSEDPHLDMSREVYERIAEAMRYAHNVDFTGWGEPLLHKRIYDMIAMAKERGCATSMTTNGTALNLKNARRLIEAGMDRLTVSIDGLTPETYDTIRIGASLKKVEANLRGLAEQVAQRGSSLELGIAFTIQEENASQIVDTPDWAHSVGARVLHLKQLNVLSTAEDWQRSLLKYRLHLKGNVSHEESSVEPSHRRRSKGETLNVLDSEDAALRHRTRGSVRVRRQAAATAVAAFSLWDRLMGRKDPLTQAEDDIRKALKRGSQLGLRIVTHSELPVKPTFKPRHCLAAPLDAVYFSYEGKVSPCCHFGHQVSRYFNGTFYPPSSLYYGDIRKSDFEEIWMSAPFNAFRRGFQSENYPKECRTCYLLYGK